MGKDNLMLGTARGKLGDVVFYRTGGEQRFRTRVRPTNPRTNAQLVQRAVVSTAVKAYSSLQEICNHAFQNFEGKLKNQERFMRLNISMLRDLALQNVYSWSPIRWTAQNYGNYVEKDSTRVLINPWIISEGDLPQINVERWGKYKNLYDVPVFHLGVTNALNTMTYAMFAEALGLNIGDQITFVWQETNVIGLPIASRTYKARIVLMPSNGDIDDLMFGGSEEGLFTLSNPNKENYGDVFFVAAENGISFMPINNFSDGMNLVSAGIIVSRFENNVWRRSDSTLSVIDTYKNVMKLTWAVESYMKSDTSSLYLNQATTQAQTDAIDAKEMILEKEGLEIDIESDTETKSKKKK